MHNLAWGYREAGKLDKALPLFEETLKRRKTKLGLDHPATLESMNALAVCYQDAGKLNQATAPCSRETLKRDEVQAWTRPPTHLRQPGQHGGCLQGRREGSPGGSALRAVAHTTEGQVRPRPPRHPQNHGALGTTYWSLKRYDKSVPLFEELVSLEVKMLGRQHPDTQHDVANLGVNYKDAGRFKEAIPLLEEAHQSSKKFPMLR